MLRVGSLFSGYGGLDMAVEEVLGARTVWVSDIEPGPSKILAHRRPGAPNLGDITQVDWTDVEPVDVIAGGSPCPDLSLAGRGAGMRPGTRSGLWASMLDAVAAIQPSYVIWENVRGALSAPASSASDMVPGPGGMGDRPGRPALRALGRVLGDLAELGYDAAWCGLRAADVGAPHGRFRVFVLAWPADTEGDPWRGGHGDDGAAAGPEVDGRAPLLTSGHETPLARTAGDRAPALLRTPTAQLATNGGSQHPDKRRSGGHGPTLADEIEHLLPTPVTDPASGNGHARHLGGEVAHLFPTPRATDGTKGGPGQRGDLALPSAVALLPTPRAADSDATMGAPGAVRHVAAGNGSLGEVLGFAEFGDYQSVIERWEGVLGRPAPSPTERTGRGGRPRLAPRFVEWMMGLPDGHVTAVPGVTRAEALRALGNGVVPHQGAAALRHLLAIRAPSGAVAA